MYQYVPFLWTLVEVNPTVDRLSTLSVESMIRQLSPTNIYRNGTAWICRKFVIHFYQDIVVHVEIDYRERDDINVNRMEEFFRNC